jgi:hypothetical protein
MVEPLHQALEVAHAVAVRILEGLDVQLVDDRVLVPVGGGRGLDGRWRSSTFMPHLPAG